MGRSARVDVVIIGGGVVGLWSLAVVRARGLSAVLLERDALGAGQTVASQGILHAGVKYDKGRDRPSASTPVLVRALRRWDEARRGEGPVDLRGLAAVSEHTWFWTTGTLASKAVALGAAALMRSDVRRVDRNHPPEVFSGAPGGVRIYEAGERVIDPRALVAHLARTGAGKIRRAEVHVELDGAGAVVVASAGGEDVRIETHRVILAAGAGNEALLPEAAAMMQRRSLHMVMLNGAPVPLFGHCLGASAVPRVTITASPSLSRAGRWVWYIGGGIAEEGVGRSREEQILACRRELGECVPWVDLEGAAFATLRIDRAEGKTDDGTRPPSFVVRQVGAALVVWPTKLVLAPLAVEEVLPRLPRDPRPDADLDALESLPVPEVAPHPWEREGLAWS